MVEGAPHTAWNNQLVCSRVPPAPVYKGAGGGGRPALGGVPGGGVLLLVGVGLPSFLLLQGGERKGEREKERGPPPPSPSPIWTKGEGRAASPGQPSLSPLRPIRPITLPGGFR